jgi:hypothetical protein
LPDELKLDECSGHQNEWMVLDATWHTIYPLEGSAACQNLGIWYNDAGIYPKTLGKLSPTPSGGDRGYPFSPDINCDLGGCTKILEDDGFCDLENVECVQP